MKLQFFFVKNQCTFNSFLYFKKQFNFSTLNSKLIKQVFVFLISVEFLLKPWTPQGAPIHLNIGILGQQMPNIQTFKCFGPPCGAQNWTFICYLFIFKVKINTLSNEKIMTIFKITISGKYCFLSNVMWLDESSHLWVAARHPQYTSARTRGGCGWPRFTYTPASTAAEQSTTTATTTTHR